MNPLLIPVGAKLGELVIDAGRQLIDALIPNDPNSPENQQKRKEAELTLFQLQQTERMQGREQEVALALAQIRLNEVEASSDSLFKSGWRPALGWACVGGFTYQAIIRNILAWLSENVGWTVPPSLEMDTLMTLLFALLGLGGYRTAEKLQAMRISSHKGH